MEGNEQRISPHRCRKASLSSAAGDRLMILGVCARKMRGYLATCHPEHGRRIDMLISVHGSTGLTMTEILIP